MRLGIFGGTFDPAHIGHMILAAEAHYQFGLDRVLWVLTPDPPHKIGRCISPIDERRRMIEAIVARDPAFALSEVDIRRPAPHFAVDTVNLLREEFPGSRLMYLMGGDSLSNLPTWHASQRFVAAVDQIGVMLRPGREPDMDVLEAALPGLKAKVQFMRAPLLEISSTEIRHRIGSGKPFRYYLPYPVYTIIRESALYREAV